MTNILHTRPPNAKLYIISCLKNAQKIKNDDPHSKQIYQFPEAFLKTDDFEAIFDSYDVLGIQTVPISYLIQGKSQVNIRRSIKLDIQLINRLIYCIALHVVGVENGMDVIKHRYPELVQEETINKVTFVYVLEEEHKRVGFSYNSAPLLHWLS